MQHPELSKFGSLLEGKVVVADTSSMLIAGTILLHKIQNCEFVIPAVVIQELEKKRKHPTLGYLAREWINLLEDLRLRHGLGLSKGVDLENNIVIRIEPNHKDQKTLPLHLQDHSADSTILAVAKNLDLDPQVVKSVVILSNDTPMRLHATLDLQLEAYEFVAAEIDGSKKYTARLELELTEDECSEISGAGEHYSLNKLKTLVHNKLSSELGHRTLIDVVLKETKEPISNVLYEHGTLSNIQRKVSASHIFGKTLEQDVALYYLKKPAAELPIVSIGGSAGTGKTLLTVATALEEVKSRNYQKIVVFRSLHEMGQGQELGFLPGDVTEKMGPWAGAIGDALDVIAETKKPMKKNEGPAAVTSRKAVAEKLLEMIEVSPITFLRGRSLSNSFIILDEAQNFSRSELLNIISRVGEGSKIVLVHDAAQVDNRFLKSGSKSEIWSVIDGFKDEELFAHVTLQKTERSRLAELASRMLED